MLRSQSILACLLWLLAGSWHLSFAQTESVDLVSKAVELLQQNQAEQAYALLNQSRLDLEGEADFDYVFGVAARATGRFTDAVFSLERAVFASPSNPEYRFLLALTYVDVGNLAAAERELSKLQTMTQRPALRSRAAQLKKQLDKRIERSGRHWRNWLQAGLGADSNANNGVDQEFIDITGLGTVTLFEQNREIDSAYTSLDGQLSLVMPRSQHEAMLVSVAVSHNEYSESLAWNRTFLNANFAYAKQIAAYKFSGTLFYRPLWLDDEEYLDYYGATLSLSSKISPTSELGADISIAQEDNQVSDSLSKQQYLISAWWRSGLLGGKQTLMVKYADESADLDENQFNERELLGLEYLWQYQSNNDWRYQLALSYLQADYQGLNPLFAEIREDELLRLQFDTYYRINANWLATAKLHIQDHTSNISLYEFSRQRIWLGVRYEF